jgi:hypothetical protein
MTRDTIQSLTGAALSEAVAEHVMGWRRLCQAEMVDRLGSTWADEKNNWHLIPRLPLDKRGEGLMAIVAETWEPHRDLRAAWQVFMASPGDKKTFRSCNNRFYALIDEGDLAEAESPEVAVCRASLLAVLATENALFP